MQQTSKQSKVYITSWSVFWLICCSVSVSHFLGILHVMKEMEQLVQKDPATVGTHNVPAFVWVSHMRDRDPGAWAVTHCLPGCTLTGDWNWKQSQDLNPGTRDELWALQIMSQLLNWFFFLFFFLITAAASLLSLPQQVHSPALPVQALPYWVLYHAAVLCFAVFLEADLFP